MTLGERLHAAAAPYLVGWRYPSGAREPRRVAYPWPKGVRGPAVADVAADRAIDCSTLTASVVMRAYPEAPWDQWSYQAMQVMDADEIDSPIEAVVRAGVGERVDALTAEAWHLAQGWRSLAPLSGHAVIVYDRGTGVLDVLESTSREGRRGPRWRTATWTGLRAEYPAQLYLARLG